MGFGRREMDFEEADRRYVELRRRYDTGTIGDEEFDAQRKRLMVRDDEGRWWAKSRKDGEWCYRGESGWVRGTPPGYPLQPVQDGSASSGTWQQDEHSSVPRATPSGSAPPRGRDDEQQSRARSGNRSGFSLVSGIVGVLLAVGLVGGIAAASSLSVIGGSNAESEPVTQSETETESEEAATSETEAQSETSTESQPADQGGPGAQSEPEAEAPTPNTPAAASEGGSEAAAPAPQNAAPADQPPSGASKPSEPPKAPAPEVTVPTDRKTTPDTPGPDPKPTPDPTKLGGECSSLPEGCDESDTGSVGKKVSPPEPEPVPKANSEAGAEPEPEEDLD